MLGRMAGINPLEDPLRYEAPVPPSAVVIFGANGDLTKRKLLPAYPLYNSSFSDESILTNTFVSSLVLSEWLVKGSLQRD